MESYTVGNDRILRDQKGYPIGHIDREGTVYDGGFFRGTINQRHNTYTDEYGRDMGQAKVNRSSSDDAFQSVGEAVGGLLILGIIAGAKWYIDKNSAEGGLRQARFVDLPVGKKKAFQLCIGSALKPIKGILKEHGLKSGRVWATTGPSFVSHGENIMISVTEHEGRAKVSIVSEPIIRLAVLSGAKNKSNVEKIANELIKLAETN